MFGNRSRRLSAQCTNIEKNKNHSLSIFAIGERASSTAFFPIGYSEKITCRTGNVLWFSDQFMSPRRERNLESVSPGPMGKTSLHISYVGVHSCVSILASFFFLSFLSSPSFSSSFFLLLLHSALNAQISRWSPCEFLLFLLSLILRWLFKKL